MVLEVFRAHVFRFAMSAAKKARLDVLATHKVTKSGLVAILQSLNDAGLLNERYTLRQVTKAVSNHANTDTPYGKLVKPLSLGDVTPHRIEYICPCALLWYLCSISPAFGIIIKESIEAAGGATLNLVLYNDGVVPGNPFRPEKARKIEAFYWIISSFPDFILHRTAAWPVITLIRTSIVNSFPAGVSRVTRELLKIFRPLQDGISLPVGNEHVVLSCSFAGFLADLLAHKEILRCTGGQRSRKPCWSCANITFRVNGDYHDDEITLACSDPARFLRYNDAELWRMIDRLHSLDTHHHTNAHRQPCY